MSLVLQSILPYPHSCLGTSPHQQGWDTKMEKLSYGGIDVSKDRLDEVLDALGEPTEIARPLACPSFGWTRGTIPLEPF